MMEGGDSGSPGGDRQQQRSSRGPRYKIFSRKKWSGGDGNLAGMERGKGGEEESESESNG